MPSLARLNSCSPCPRPLAISGSFCPPKKNRAISRMSRTSCGAKMLAWTRSIPAISLSPYVKRIVTTNHWTALRTRALFASCDTREAAHVHAGTPLPHHLSPSGLGALSSGTRSACPRAVVPAPHGALGFHPPGVSPLRLSPTRSWAPLHGCTRPIPSTGTLPDGHCWTAAPGLLDHEGQGHEKIREGNDFGVPKVILEESLDLKTNDACEAPDHQRLGLPVLGPDPCRDAPGVHAIGPPYPQPAGQPQQAAFRRDLNEIIMQMPQPSGGIHRAVRRSIRRIAPLHRAHPHACPGMGAEDADATGPHGEALLGGNVPTVGDAQHPALDGRGDQEEDDEHAQWDGQHQHLLRQADEDTPSCQEAAPGAAGLGHQQGRRDEEQGKDRPQ